LPQSLIPGVVWHVDVVARAPPGRRAARAEPTCDERQRCPFEPSAPDAPSNVRRAPAPAGPQRPRALRGWGAPAPRSINRLLSLRRGLIKVRGRRQDRGVCARRAGARTPSRALHPESWGCSRQPPAMRSTQIADQGLESAERAPTRFAEGGLNGARLSAAPNCQSRAHRLGAEPVTVAAAVRRGEGAAGGCRQSPRKKRGQHSPNSPLVRRLLREKRITGPHRPRARSVSAGPPALDFRRAWPSWSTCVS
jgi:hypothetical protein